MTEKCTKDNMKKIRTKHDKQGYSMYFFFFKVIFTEKRRIQRGVFELYLHQRSNIQLWRENCLLLQKNLTSHESLQWTSVAKTGFYV